MNKTYLKLIVLVFLITFLSCGEMKKEYENKSPLPFKLLPGTWFNEQAGIYENWETIDRNLVGKAYKINDVDTIFLEKLRIFKEQDDYYYEATVPDQNNGKPVRFKLSSFDEKKLTFENPTHDFPQVIEYFFTNEKHIKVTIRGVEEELEKEIIFSYKKISNLSNGT